MLTLIGVVGLYPLRISGKEWAVEFFDDVADAIDSAPASVKQDIADKLFLDASSSGRDATSRLAGAVQSSIAFENHAVKTVVAEFGRISDYNFEYQRSSDFDAVLHFQGRRIAIEAKKFPNQASVDTVRRKARASLASGEIAGLILIVQDDDVTRRFARSSDIDERFWLVSESNLDLLQKILIRWEFDINWG